MDMMAAQQQPGIILNALFRSFQFHYTRPPMLNTILVLLQSKF